MKKRTTKVYVKGLAAAASLAVLFSLASVPAPANAEAPAISVSNWPGNTVKAPIIKPSWTFSVDKPAEAFSSQQSAAEDGMVFAFKGKQLVALNAQTGKLLWKYGSKLAPFIVYHDGIVYGITEGGNVYALDAKNGRKKWASTVKLPGSAALTPIGDTVYAALNSETYAFEAATGKLRWKADEPQSEGGGGAVLEAEGVVFRTFLVQGALTSVQLDAFDKQTGKKLWGVFRQNSPLTVRNGLVYSIADPSPFQDYSAKRQVTIKAFNIKTGVVKEERVYTWTLSGQPPFAIAGGSALLDGNDLYVFQDDKIVQYDFAKYVPDGKPVKKWYRPYSNAEVVGSIYKERMFFIDYATGELKGMKLANGQQIGWRGDNPAAQTDIFGNGVYIGQTDGLFHGFNLQTTAAAFTVNTGSRNYGPTLKTGEMIVIQTEGRLISVKIPKSLK